jgi:hypothetical protein
MIRLDGTDRELFTVLKSTKFCKVTQAFLNMLDWYVYYRVELTIRKRRKKIPESTHEW